MSEVKQSASRDLIYQSDHLSVVHSERGGDVVLVTFNEMGLHANGTRFWGAELLESMDISAIGFVSSRPNWYPPRDMMAAIDEAVGRVRGRKVITYGFSQGGYGALKYGRMLKADLALAFSPQWSINPEAVASFDKRFTAFYDPLLKNGEPVTADDLAKTNILFVDDGHAGDRESARRLEVLGPVFSVKIPFMSHDTVRLLSEARIGRPLIKLCLEEVPSPARLRTILRGGRSRSSTYTRYKLQRLLSSINRHGGYYDAAVSTMPNGAGRTMAMVHMHLARGSEREAERVFASIADEDLLALDLVPSWQIFRSCGFRHGEARFAPLFRQKFPDNVFLRLHGVNSMIACGEFDMALQELAILERLPGAAMHKSLFVQFFKQLDRAELAAQFLDALATNDDRIRPDRVKLGLELVAVFRSRGLRAEAFRELVSLSTLCKGDPGSSLTVLQNLVAIGEYGFAERVLETNLAPAEGITAYEDYSILFQSKRDLTGARKRLEHLLQQNDRSSEFWLRLAHTARFVSGLDADIQACKNAVHSAGSGNVDARFRLASVLAESGRLRQARSELRRCVVSWNTQMQAPQRLIDLALKLGDPQLGAIIADRWKTMQPDSVTAQLECGRIQIQVGELIKAEDSVRLILRKLQSGLRLDIAQFRAMLAMAECLCDDVRSCVSKAAIAAFPDEIEFRSKSDSDRFLAKFRPPPHGTTSLSETKGWSTWRALAMNLGRSPLR